MNTQTLLEYSGNQEAFFVILFEISGIAKSQIECYRAISRDSLASGNLYGRFNMDEHIADLG